MWFQPTEEGSPKGDGALYITNGQGSQDQGPTFIGPVQQYVHPSKTLTNGTNTTANNSTHTITAAEGYAISKITVDSDGHVSSADAVIMPTGGSGMTAHTLSGQYHSDVDAGSPSGKDVLAWNSTSMKWTNQSIAKILGVDANSNAKVLTNNGSTVSWTGLSYGVNTDVWADAGTSISVHGDTLDTAIIDHWESDSPSEHGNSKGVRLMGTSTSNSDYGTQVEFTVGKSNNSIIDVECKVNVIFGGTW